MNFDKIIYALQGLIIRLQDAENEYNELKLGTENEPLKKWLSRYAEERHQMHKELESHVALIGGDAEVKTSFLGDLHRIFIEVKLNNTSNANEFDAIVTEIKRGSTTLIDDYSKAINNLELSENLKKVLISQRATIQNELKQMVNLKKEFNTSEV